MAAFALCLAGSSAAPELEYVGNVIGVGIGDVPEGAPMVFGDIPLCVSSSEVRIVSVEPIHPTGAFTVTRFLVRPNPYKTGGEMLGTDHVSLAATGFRGGTTVSAHCGKTGDVDELAVEAVRRSVKPAVAHGIRIDYIQGTAHGHVDLPWTVTLCGGTAGATPCPGAG
ncbi:MAG TPA: hypothetical protein VN107_00215 [Microbacterium sp.]|nr:hypothetical protein [Microbacterium sp.]